MCPTWGRADMPSAGGFSSRAMRTVVTVLVLLLAAKATPQGRAKDAGFRWPNERNRSPEWRDYVRVSTSRTSKPKEFQAVLQTSVRVLKNPDGSRVVVLASLHHIGSAEYFRSLEPYIEGASVVIREGPIMDIKPEDVHPDGLWLRRERIAVASLCGLVRQFDWEESVQDKRWKPVGILMSVFNDRLTKSDVVLVPPQRQRLIVRLERAAAGEIPTSDLAARSKKQFFADAERNPDRSGAFGSIQSEREGAMWEGIKGVLKDLEDGKIVLLFGGAHAYFIERTIVAETSFRHYCTSWHDAMSYLFTR